MGGPKRSVGPTSQQPGGSDAAESCGADVGCGYSRRPPAFCVPQHLSLAHWALYQDGSTRTPLRSGSIEGAHEADIIERPGSAEPWLWRSASLFNVDAPEHRNEAGERLYSGTLAGKPVGKTLEKTLIGPRGA